MLNLLRINRLTNYEGRSVAANAACAHPEVFRRTQGGIK
jgi:hypothetical protein